MTIEKDTVDDTEVEMDDFDQLQAIVKEAAELSLQADTRVGDLQQRIDYLEEEITNKETKLKEGTDSWSLEKTTLVAKVAELSNFLSMKGEESKGPTEKEGALEREVMILKMNLDETTKLMEESKEAANQMRNRMLEGEDLLEYEQMRFKKEKKELDTRIEEERSKLNSVAREFQKEQDKYADERDDLMEKIDNALSKLTETEKQMTKEKNRFDSDTSTKEKQIRDLKSDLERAQDQLVNEAKRFSAERRELNQEIDVQKQKLQRSENELRDTKEDFQRARKDLEKKLTVERIRVERLTKDLENETQNFVREKSELQGQLMSERTKLSEVETELEEETKRFDKERRDLKNQVSEGERIRKLKARQMNNRYTAIRDELTQKVEGAKRDGRRENKRLTEKFEKKIQEVNDNVLKLQGDLVDAGNNYEKLTVQLGDMAAANDRVLLEKENSERQYRTTISARNIEITGLKEDVQNLNGEITELDDTVNRYESSYRQMAKLSLSLTGRRIKNVAKRVRRRKGGDDDEESL